jgi:hypothetical protein
MLRRSSADIEATWIAVQNPWVLDLKELLPQEHFWTILGNLDSPILGCSGFTCVMAMLRHAPDDTRSGPCSVCRAGCAATAQELAINWLEKKWDKEGLAGVQVSHTVASICC